METYRIMSFNIRIQTLYDQEQQFIYRVDPLCRFLRELAPDVCGLQEISPMMRQEMLQRLPGYAILGGGREADHLGEAAAILYRSDRLMPERLLSEMLSFAPHKAGSTYGGDQSRCPRVFSSVDFMPFTGGQPFRVMNIHTDHEGVNARKLEIAQFLRSYEEQQALRPVPTVLTGDFNALPEAEEMQILSESSFTDITKDLKGTFHDYDRLAEPEKIDYIWVSPEWKVGPVRQYHRKEKDLFLSDHDPILAELTL